MWNYIRTIFQPGDKTWDSVGDQSWTEISAILLPPPSAVWQQRSIKTSHGLSKRKKIDFAQLKLINL